MFKRVALGKGKWILRRTITDRHNGPIDSYQNRQLELIDKAEERRKLADKIRLNIERTWSGSDHQLMLWNKYEDEGGYDQYNTTESKDPVLNKLAKMVNEMSTRKRRQRNQERFEGYLDFFGGQMRDKVRDFQSAIQQRKMSEPVYEFLRTTPMTKIFDTWITEAKKWYDSIKAG